MMAVSGSKPRTVREVTQRFTVSIEGGRAFTVDTDYKRDDDGEFIILRQDGDMIFIPIEMKAQVINAINNTGVE